MTIEALAAVAQEFAQRYPGARLVKNLVGNLLIVIGGETVGWIDLLDGTAHHLADR